MRRAAACLAAAFVFAVATPALAEDRGSFGVGLSIDGDGFFLNPTVRAVRIDAVVPRSPADRAGLRVGDEVVEIGGRAVVGAKGRDLQSIAETKVGAPLTLRVRHRGGDVVSVTMVAVERSALDTP